MKLNYRAVQTPDDAFFDLVDAFESLIKSDTSRTRAFGTSLIEYFNNDREFACKDEDPGSADDIWSVTHVLITAFAISPATWSEKFYGAFLNVLEKKIFAGLVTLSTEMPEQSFHMREYSMGNCAEQMLNWLNKIYIATHASRADQRSSVAAVVEDCNGLAIYTRLFGEERATAIMEDWLTRSIPDLRVVLRKMMSSDIGRESTDIFMRGMFDANAEDVRNLQRLVNIFKYLLGSGGHYRRRMLGEQLIYDFNQPGIAYQDSEDRGLCSATEVFGFFRILVTALLTPPSRWSEVFYRAFLDIVKQKIFTKLVALSCEMPGGFFVDLGRDTVGGCIEHMLDLLDKVYTVTHSDNRLTVVLTTKDYAGLEIYIRLFGKERAGMILQDLFTKGIHSFADLQKVYTAIPQLSLAGHHGNEAITFLYDTLIRCYESGKMSFVIQSGDIDRLTTPVELFYDFLSEEVLLGVIRTPQDFLDLLKREVPHVILQSCTVFKTSLRGLLFRNSKAIDHLLGLMQTQIKNANGDVLTELMELYFLANQDSQYFEGICSFLTSENFLQTIFTSIAGAHDFAIFLQLLVLVGRFRDRAYAVTLPSWSRERIEPKIATNLEGFTIRDITFVLGYDWSGESLHGWSPAYQYVPMLLTPSCIRSVVHNMDDLLDLLRAHLQYFNTCPRDLHEFPDLDRLVAKDAAIKQRIITTVRSFTDIEALLGLIIADRAHGDVHRLGYGYPRIICVVLDAIRQGKVPFVATEEAFGAFLQRNYSKIQELYMNAIHHRFCDLADFIKKLAPPEHKPKPTIMSGLFRFFHGSAAPAASNSSAGPS